MGLIRKSLMVSTGGVVRGSSKKQRVAKTTMKHARATAANTAQTNAVLQQQATQQALVERQRAEAEKKRADDEAAYRYATDPTYRDYVDAQRAAAAIAAEAQRVELARAADLKRVAAEHAAAERAERNKHNVEVGVGVASYIALAVAFALVGTFVWSVQSLSSAVRKQPRHLWKQADLGTAWKSAGQRVRQAGSPDDVAD